MSIGWVSPASARLRVVSSFPKRMGLSIVLLKIHVLYCHLVHFSGDLPIEMLIHDEITDFFEF